MTQISLVVALGWFGCSGQPLPPGLSALPPAKATPPTASAEEKSAPFRVVVRRPSGPPVVKLEPSHPDAEGGRVACPTCHSIRSPNLDNRAPSDLDEFHQQMSLAHGTLACYSCHHPDNANALRLADGQELPFPDVMTLCAQCHGPQAADYQRGAHGGMVGYWDLSRGGRVRNNCIDCHDPHVPAFPTMLPTFPPRDRFLTPSESHGGPHFFETPVSESHGE